ncbi:carbohydrate-binding protein [Paenibacillus whitsoniae]|uniref:Carbohydrate-binding protein n=1 Tax=Paenibacillus whitsoniae TaxID=2496558 RepID=A0A3S0A469_9BACL|nr:carbohydrate-binding protein [Paenibacillus whitsoniae]RTE09204.1 carbohydrate-binding protein [Paenibacillus whitsoniae]
MGKQGKRFLKLLTCLGMISMVIGVTPAFAATPGSVIFQSGFESGSTLSQLDAQDDDITGTDTSYSTKNNWVTDLEGNAQIGTFKIQYEGGAATDRYASIITDPAYSGNKVLHYWLKNAAIQDNGFMKGRIQTSIYDEPGNPQQSLNEMYYKVRLKLHPDMQKLESFSNAIPWLTLAEFWNDPTWTGSSYPFRITFGLNKDANAGSNQPLYFSVSSENMDNNTRVEVWRSDAKSFTVTYNQWITLEFYYKKGDATTGRFYVAATPSGGSRQILFDVKNWTYNTNNPSPVGLANFNPMKLYTGEEYIDHIRNNGGIMQLYWDNFELWNGWPQAVYQAESMTLGTTSGETLTNSSDVNCSGGVCQIFDSNGVGDYINYYANVPHDGKYDIKVGVKKMNTRGKFQMSIDGANIGTIQDLYAASAQYTELSIANNVQLAAGDRRFKFYVTGTSGTGYQLGIDYIKIIPKD